MFARLVLCLLFAVAEAMFGAQKPANPIKADLPYIECAVCQELAAALVKHVEEMPPPPQPAGRVGSRGKVPKGKVSEADVSDLLENVCNPKEKQGRWLSTFDLVSKNGLVELETQSGPGKCNRECQTIAQSCTDLFGKIEDSVDDLQVALWKGRGKEEITETLCGELSEVCPRKTNMKPVERKVDEEFRPMSDKDIEMEELMSKLQGMPGMGGSSMMSADDLQSSMEKDL